MSEPSQEASFAKVVADEFSFLTKIGFLSTPESPNTVLFEGPNDVFVRVFHDTNDKYLGFRVGLTSRPRDAPTAEELATIGGGPPPPGEFVEHADQLRGSIRRVADLLMAKGDRILSGDESILYEAMELRQAHTRRFTQKPD